jgi:hypothetical protein
MGVAALNPEDGQAPDRPLNGRSVMSRGTPARLGHSVASKLCYDSVLVGEIADPFEHQGTWFGNFTSRLPADGNETQRRLADFIAFCERWHQRLKAGDDPDAGEFDAFGLVRPDLWEVVDEGGDRVAIDQWPLFVEGEVSWTRRSSRGRG